MRILNSTRLYGVYQLGLSGNKSIPFQNNNCKLEIKFGEIYIYRNYKPFRGNKSKVLKNI